MNQVRFSHVNGDRLRYSIAYNFEKAGDNLKVNFGIAQCAKSDAFNRETGRNLATARLSKALAGNTGAYYGTVEIADGEGVSVSREIQKLFESERKLRMKAINASDIAGQEALNKLANDLSQMGYRIVPMVRTVY